MTMIEFVWTASKRSQQHSTVLVICVLYTCEKPQNARGTRTQKGPLKKVYFHILSHTFRKCWESLALGTTTKHYCASV